MRIIGLLVTLDASATRRADAMRAIEAHPAFELGEASGPLLPLVLEALDGNEERAALRWLQSLEGVLFFSLCAGFVEHDTTAASPAPAPTPERADTLREQVTS